MNRDTTIATLRTDMKGCIESLPAANTSERPILHEALRYVVDKLSLEYTLRSKEKFQSCSVSLVAKEVALQTRIDAKPLSSEAELLLDPSIRPSKVVK